MQMQVQPQERFMRLPEVIATTGYKRASIYRLMASGEFPQSIPLGERAVGWLASDVQAWIDERILAAE